MEPCRGVIDGGSCVKVSVRAAPELGPGSGHLAPQDLEGAAFILFYWGGGERREAFNEERTRDNLKYPNCF